ncbi:hypothetical protein PUNSTDRAFT_122475, partial [Punctularia strigosozonata HHB-11173 SS5]
MVRLDGDDDVDVDRDGFGLEDGLEILERARPRCMPFRPAPPKTHPPLVLQECGTPFDQHSLTSSAAQASSGLAMPEEACRPRRTPFRPAPLKTRRPSFCRSAAPRSIDICSPARHHSELVQYRKRQHQCHRHRPLSACALLRYRLRARLHCDLQRRLLCHTRRHHPHLPFLHKVRRRRSPLCDVPPHPLSHHPLR